VHGGETIILHQLDRDGAVVAHRPRPDKRDVEKPIPPELSVTGWVMGDEGDKLAVLVRVSNSGTERHTLVEHDFSPQRIWITREHLLPSGVSQWSTRGLISSSHPRDPGKLPHIVLDPGESFESVVATDKPTDFRMQDLTDEYVTLGIGIQIRGRAGEGQFKEMLLRGELHDISQK